MCDNSLIADQFRARLAQATDSVDEALESVRAMRRAILAQVATSNGGYLDQRTERVEEVVDMIHGRSGVHKLPHRTLKEMCSVCASKTAEVSIYTGDEVYISQEEYIDLLKCKDQVKRVRELHKSVTETNAACGNPDCCGEYEEYEMCADCQCDYPCPTIQALDGEIGSIEPVKSEALDGEK